jgi:hypothetical protein
VTDLVLALLSRWARHARATSRSGCAPALVLCLVAASYAEAPPHDIDTNSSEANQFAELEAIVKRLDNATSPIGKLAQDVKRGASLIVALNAKPGHDLDWKRHLPGFGFHYM